MIKFLLMILILFNFSISSFAQERYFKSELTDFIQKELAINKKLTNSERYKSYFLVSTGLGYYMEASSKARTNFDIDMTLDFTNRIFLSLKFDSFSNPGGAGKNWTLIGLAGGQYLNIYFFSEARWYIGLSVAYNAGNTNDENFFPFMLLLNTKLEYDLSDLSSANLEIRPIIGNGRFYPVINLNFALRFKI